MHWGPEYSVGHYIDLVAGLAGWHDFQLGIILVRSRGRLHHQHGIIYNPAPRLDTDLVSAPVELG